MPSPTAAETDEPTPNQPAQSDRRDEFDHLRERLETLETRLERKDDRIEDLERDRDRLEGIVDQLDHRVAELEAETERLEADTEQLERDTDRLDSETDRLETETTRLDSVTDAALNKAGANKERIAELQSRELEKGAHLRTEHVDEHAVTVPEGRLERIEKDDGAAYYRLPEHADPLERGGDVSLAYGDLLPIQQLARMDDQRRRSAANALPTRLAAKLWQARTDPSVGDDPWERGCKDVVEFVTASDLKHWIRRTEPGISESYAKKLVSRTIDSLLDLSKNRLAVRRKTERKNGLEYTERRVILPADASIPGEAGRDEATDSTHQTESTSQTENETPDSSDPETADVHG
ncbi:hypothetical protein [Natronorubrum texcoconense]|uniref:Uncharacterized protein n=1 Tax=Natronorubrum texcoconense TaxID=1095776 RepID=A0A1G9G238_9EURY|nr:hypothetical protein [Natronorubrum texcoconense]SDK94696.1 hypothetical protein SAMN04515672_4387 [Natronorubrum texcoconense]